MMLVHMTKKRQMLSSEPWEAMFTSIMRPHDAASSESSAGGYVILLQQSTTCLSFRRHLTQSTRVINNSDGGSNDDTHVGWGMTGTFLAKRMFEELCLRCGGAVVLVSLLGGEDWLLDVDESVNHNDDGYSVHHRYDANEYYATNTTDDKGSEEWRKSMQAKQSFRRHGAIVDLSSNSFGWDTDQYDDTDKVEGNISNNNDTGKAFVQKCTINNIQSIVQAIRCAVATIESRRSLNENQHDAPFKTTKQPVPIMFDTLTPFLHVHSMSRFITLLKLLKTVSSPYRLSPIVVPVQYESLRPSEMRYLEDAADAFIHIESTQNNDTLAGSCILDIVRHGGTDRTMGGKLIHHRVPFSIMMSSPLSCQDSTRDDRMMRQSYYWILHHNAKDCDKNADPPAVRSTKTMSAEAPDDKPKPTSANSSGPRIYYEPNDPDFEFYDEEDELDDDLDI